MLTKTLKLFIITIPFFLFSNFITKDFKAIKPQDAGNDIYFFPVQFTDFVPCTNNGNGELIQFEGNIQIIVHYSVDKRGGVHFKYQVNYQGVSGVGLTTGLKYQTPGPYIEKVFVVDGESDEIYHLNLIYMIIGQGPGNNFKLHSNFSYVIQDGKLHMVQENSGISCD